MNRSIHPACQLIPHQIVLTVADLERAVQYYLQFGFELVHRIIKPDGRARAALASPRLKGFELKLFSGPNVGPSVGSQDKDDYLREVGTKYFSLLTDDVDQFYLSFKGRINFLSPPKDGYTGCRYVFFRDLDGILVEVYERDGASKPFKAVEQST